MNIKTVFPVRYQHKPLSDLWIIRFLTILVLVLALTAGYLYVSTQSQARVIEALKRRTAPQQLDGTAAPR